MYFTCVHYYKSYLCELLIKIFSVQIEKYSVYKCFLNIYMHTYFNLIMLVYFMGWLNYSGLREVYRLNKVCLLILFQ